MSTSNRQLDGTHHLLTDCIEVRSSGLSGISGVLLYLEWRMTIEE